MSKGKRPGLDDAQRNGRGNPASLYRMDRAAIVTNFGASMIEIDLGLDCESPETVSRRQLCQELQAALQRAAAAESALVKLHEDLWNATRRGQECADLCNELQDENERLKRERT